MSLKDRKIPDTDFWIQSALSGQYYIFRILYKNGVFIIRFEGERGSKFGNHFNKNSKHIDSLNRTINEARGLWNHLAEYGGRRITDYKEVKDYYEHP